MSDPDFGAEQPDLIRNNVLKIEASGGLCGPEFDRSPVMDLFPTFKTQRGAIRFGPSPTPEEVRLAAERWAKVARRNRWKRRLRPITKPPLRVLRAVGVLVGTHSAARRVKRDDDDEDGYDWDDDW